MNINKIYNIIIRIFGAEKQKKMIPKTLIEDLKRNAKWLTVDAVIGILEDFKPATEQPEPTPEAKQKSFDQEITEAVNAMKF